MTLFYYRESYKIFYNRVRLFSDFTLKLEVNEGYRWSQGGAQEFLVIKTDPNNFLSVLFT